MLSPRFFGPPRFPSPFDCCLRPDWLGFVTEHSSLLVVAIVAVLITARTVPGIVLGDAMSRTVTSFLGVFAVWCVLALISHSHHPPLALATFVTVGACCIGLFADQVATHYVFWASANPRVERKTMLGWRKDWSARFLGMSDRPPYRPNLSAAQRQQFIRTMRLRRFYPWGFAILMLAFVLAAAMGLVAARARGTEGITIVIALQTIVVLLAVAAGYRVMLPGAISVFTKALGSYYGYGRNPADPPWVFHSPVGNRLTRRVWLIVATAMLTVLVATLTVSQGLQLDAPTSPRGLAIRFALVAVVVPGLVAPLLLVLGAFVATAPTLVACHDALEVEGGLELHPEWTDFDGYLDRLRTSNNSIERRSNIIGFHPLWEFPILADTDLYLEHQHVLGATGIGKTALSVTTDVIQLIRRGDGPVIIIDCKGDRALFETARLESEQAGTKVQMVHE